MQHTFKKNTLTIIFALFVNLILFGTVNSIEASRKQGVIKPTQIDMDSFVVGLTDTGPLMLSDGVTPTLDITLLEQPLSPMATQLGTGANSSIQQNNFTFNENFLLPSSGSNLCNGSFGTGDFTCWTAPVDPLVRVLDIASNTACLLYTSPSPRDGATSRMPSSA